MTDLRSEIEARKHRIAELKRQREALALSGTGRPVAAAGRTTSSPATVPRSNLSTKAIGLTIVSPSIAQVQVDKPFLYPRTVQTDPVEVAGEDQSEVNDSAELLRGSAAEEINVDDIRAESEGSSGDGTAFRVVEEPLVFPASLVAFVEDSWRAVARSGAKTTAIRDYTSSIQGATNVESAKSGASELIKPVVPKLQRSSHCIAWSPHFEDLFASRSAEDPRRAYLWSTEATDTPEFVLRSSTPITRLLFSPHSANYVYAGGENGQVMAWDIKDRTSTAGSRVDLLPQLRSSIEGSAIVALQVVGVNLVSLNEEGVVHVFSSDVLSRPRHTILLEDKFRGVFPSLKMSSSAIFPTAMAIYSSVDAGFGLGYGTGTFVVGSIEGHLFRVPAVPSAVPKAFTWRHAATVTCLAFRPLPAPPADDGRRLGGLLLSGGLDWRIRVWLVPNNEADAPVELLSIAIDFSVADVVWHPTIPSVFVAAGENCVQIWNLDRNIVKPVYTSTNFADPEEKNHTQRGIGGDIFNVAFNSRHNLLGIASASYLTVNAMSEDAALQGSDSWLLENSNYKRI